MLPLLGLGLALAIPLLVFYAGDAILESTDGELETPVTDPNAPGYETLVLATPSHLLLSTDDAGGLAMVAVMALSANDRGGTVLLVPPETLSIDGRLADVFGAGGADAVRFAVARTIGAEVDAMTVVDGASWATFTAPVAPLTVQLNESLVTDDGTVVFPAGATAVASEQFGEVMGWVNPGESRFNRLARQRALWESWIAAIEGAGVDAVSPGEADDGIGRMVRGLASGVFRIVDAPVAERTDVGVFDLDQAALDAVVAEMLPFPLSPEPGGRARVRLLDGVGGQNLANTIAPGLVAADAQIVVVGNAATFDVATTSVVYHDQQFADHAQGFSAALGSAPPSFEPLTDAVLDVTIIVGRDIIEN